MNNSNSNYNDSFNKLNQQNNSVNNLQEEMDEYDKYLQMELKNLKKQTPKKFSSNNKILQMIDKTNDQNDPNDQNIYNEKNFIMKNDESINFGKSRDSELDYELDNTPNINLNQKENEIFYFNKNAFNINANNPKSYVESQNIHNTFENKNKLQISENGNLNTNVDFIRGNNDNMNILNNNLNNNSNRNINFIQEPRYKGVMKDMNFSSNLNDYLIDKPHQIMDEETPKNKNNQYEDLIDDNEKYMFSNNIDYTNYNVNTNFNNENIDADVTAEIINSTRKKNNIKPKNFETFQHNNKQNNFNFLNANNVVDINSLDDDINFNVNSNPNNINNITNSNFAEHDVNQHENHLDYKDIFLREGKVNKDVFVYNHKQTEYKSIIENTNENINMIKNSKNFNNMNNFFREDEKMDRIYNIYDYESELNKQLDEKLKKVNEMNNMKNTSVYRLAMKIPTNERVNFDFVANNIKTLSDQTASMSEHYTFNKQDNSNVNLNFKNVNNSKNIFIDNNENDDSDKNRENSEKIDKNDVNENSIVNRKNEDVSNKNNESVANYSVNENEISQNDIIYKRNRPENTNRFIIEKTPLKNQGLNQESIQNNLTERENSANFQQNHQTSESNQNKEKNDGQIPILNEKNKGIKQIIQKNPFREINITNNLLNNTSNLFNNIISNPEYEQENNQGFVTLQPDKIQFGNFNRNTSNQSNYNQEYLCGENTQNESKLKALQIKIEEKIRQEYQNKILFREREIADKTKIEFEEAMKSLKGELEKNLDEEKKKLEEDLEKKWEDKYETLIVECKSKLRNDKEKKLAERMYQKLKPVVEKEIYKKEYNRVEDKIRSELESKIKNEIQTLKSEELEKVKKKFETYKKSKIEEMESNIKSKFKEQYEGEMKKEIEKKEKEIKINYLNKFENFKSNLENQLKEEYENKKKDLFKEVNEMKAKIYSQKCAENLKLQKINKLKDKLHKNEINHLQNAGKLEKILSSKSKEKKTNNYIKNSTSKNKNYGENLYNGNIVNESYYQQENLQTGKRSNWPNNTHHNLENNYHSNNTNLNLNNRSNLNNSNTNNHTQNQINKKTELFLDFADNSENNIRIFKNLNMNSPTSEINQNISHNNFNLNNFSNYNINEELQANLNNITNNINNASFSSGGKQKQKGETSPQRMNNAVNLQELNKRLKSQMTVNKVRRENSYFLKEIQTDQEILPVRTLQENLKEIIEKNSKLNIPHSELGKDNQIIYRKITNINIPQDNNKKEFASNQINLNELNKTILNKGLSNISMNSNFVQNENNVMTVNKETNVNTSLSPKNEILNKNNITTNLSFIKSINQAAMEQNLSNKNHNCLSLNIEKNIPLSLVEFGKFLVKFIEKDENYRILFEKEIKKIKEKIKKIFEKNNQSDHCLLEYLIELWDKLEVSYSQRYKIVIDLCKKNSPEIYNFLDLETEFITEYFKNTQNIFNLIKNREKIKSKLQIKSNRNELSLEDKQKFKNLTSEIEKKIKQHKEKNKISIIWRGLEYEWMINYENWFYESK